MGHVNKLSGWLSGWLCFLLGQEKWQQVKKTRKEKGLWYKDDVFPDDTDDEACYAMSALLRLAELYYMTIKSEALSLL